MLLHGRTRELGRLRSLLDRREASFVHVSGVRGVGKTALLERVLEDYPALHFRCAPRADEAQQACLWQALGTRMASLDGPPGDWAALLNAALTLAEPGRSAFVIVLDDAYRLVHGRSRISDAVARTLRQARAEDRTFHIVTVSHTSAPMDAERLAGMFGGEVHVEPLSFRAALPFLPGTTPRDFIRSYGTFGGIPNVLRAVDQSVTLSTNIRNLLLEPGATLADAGRDWIERDVQNPTRYYAVLSALAEGETDWATVHGGVPDLTTSGQVAPYLHRLEELGLVRTRRSLDAGPRSRSRRYRMSDPFLAFWHRFVLPRLHDMRGDSTSYLNDAIRPSRDDHTQNVFAEICRQFMAHDALGVFGSNARESGSLWGSGYEIDSAGILGSGAAFYGNCFWRQVTDGGGTLTALDEAIRENRYGFGREHRQRILFTARPLPRALEREVARRHNASIIGPGVLAGMADE
jgi:AAA+ ATPase superfamily predicted ATPase